MIAFRDGGLLRLYPDEQTARHIVCRRDERSRWAFYQHREGVVAGFTKRYGLKQLVHFERYDTPTLAIQREKNIKHWPRMWKLDLINESNPQWRDLYNDVTR
jgi:putative endonuclease